MASDRCPCGGVILADTEDWDIPLCYECYEKSNEGRNAIFFDLKPDRIDAG